MDANLQQDSFGEKKENTFIKEVAPLKIMKIKRIAMIEDGTFGIIFDEKIPFALTLERKWENNQKSISCIPKGEYTCIRVISSKFGDTFEVMNVPNRSNILFHRGNLDMDSHGCILIGEEFGKINEKVAILSSSRGFDEFQVRLLSYGEFKLLIEEV